VTAQGSLHFVFELLAETKECRWGQQSSARKSKAREKSKENLSKMTRQHQKTRQDKNYLNLHQEGV
jgi:hypothetical protein